MLKNKDPESECVIYFGIKGILNVRNQAPKIKMEQYNRYLLQFIPGYAR